MKSNLNYCIVLSSEQLTYLSESKYGIDRMKILHRLIEKAVLSSKLGYDKKTVSRVLDKMNQLGIVTSTQSNRTSIHTLKCISAWMQDGNRIDNPFYVRLKDRPDDMEGMPVNSVK